jgi:Uncharacterised nucleotidyltransferase
MTTANRRLRLKDAVIASFHEPASVVSARLGEFSESDWRKAIVWLDLSGLALYLLDRITFLGVSNCLPKPILDRLHQNLADNRERTSDLFRETVTICSALERDNIPFALLKGVSLSPEPVSDVALRCQMDIDILIRSQDVKWAQDIVQGFGYFLDSVKGREWVFTSGNDKPLHLASLYKVRPQRMIEFHLLPAMENSSATAQRDLLASTKPRCFMGTELPVLSPEDIFVQQALHIFKHICSERTRAQWVLEFWWHVHMRRDDLTFWKNVESLVSIEPQADVAIGVVTLLATQLFGEFAPEELARCSLDRLPPAVRLWVETYGRRVLLTDFSASKFYLLLRRQIHKEAKVPHASSWRLLLPFHWWPVRISRATVDEQLAARLMRYRAEARYVFSRLWFHVRTSLPYAIESQRWQRRIAALRQ